MGGSLPSCEVCGCLLLHEFILPSAEGRLFCPNCEARSHLPRAVLEIGRLRTELADCRRINDTLSRSVETLTANLRAVQLRAAEVFDAIVRAGEPIAVACDDAEGRVVTLETACREARSELLHLRARSDLIRLLDAALGDGDGSQKREV